MPMQFFKACGPLKISIFSILATVFIGLNLLSCQNQKPDFVGRSIRPQGMNVLSARQLPAGIYDKMHFDLSSQKQTISQTMTLKADPPLVTQLKQIDRPKGEEVFRQGHDGDGSIFERFYIQEAGKLDLLIVVDNSSSMAPYQDRLAPGLRPLLSHLANTDWRIMVTLTSPIRRPNRENPRNPTKIYGCPRINSQDPNDRSYISRDDFIHNETQAMERFRWKISAGEQGEPIEHGILAAVSGLIGECGDQNHPWTREGSHKAVLLLSDEENCGSDPDQNCDQDLDADPQFFLDRVPGNTKFFALLHDKDLYPECTDDGYIRKPSDYRTLIQKTGGIEGNICSGRYDDTLVEISRHIKPVPVSAFTLAYPPHLKTMEILVDGKPITQTPIVEKKTLRFEPPLLPDAKILQIHYKHDPEEIRHSFKLVSQDIDSQSIVVSVDGQAVPADSYEYVARSNTLIFHQQPPERSLIKIAYRSSKLLPKSFPWGHRFLPETLQVKIQGEETTAFTFDTTSQTIVFNRPPADGDEIEIRYEDGHQRQTVYPKLPIPPADDFELSAEDTATGQAIPIEQDESFIRVPYHEIRDGRKMTVSYGYFLQMKDVRINLPHPVERKTLVLTGGNQTCIQSAYWDGTDLVFPCSPRNLGEVSIDYDLFKGLRDTFPIGQEIPNETFLRIFVNQERIYDFEILADKVRIPWKYLNKDAVIRIEVAEVVVL
jgi:hypothetical protein